MDVSEVRARRGRGGIDERLRKQACASCACRGLDRATALDRKRQGHSSTHNVRSRNFARIVVAEASLEPEHRLSTAVAEYPVDSTPRIAAGRSKEGHQCCIPTVCS